MSANILTIFLKKMLITEALAAKDYFAYYHEGLNRRGDDPINSRLNYGYAVVRSSISRSLVAAGFHPTFGIHHDSQLNAFNLADDLVEPYRAIVDIVAHHPKDERNTIKSLVITALLASVLFIATISAGLIKMYLDQVT